MYKSVVESAPELWHYTTTQGLHGILTSQQLWATDISYLNDMEEFSGFFDRKLLGILEEAVQKGIADASKTVEGLNNINAQGGQAVVARELPCKLRDVLREATLNLQVYVTSFCNPSEQDGEDGLLSQWRGYGSDGGFAIVFDTAVLGKLMLDEQQKFFYSFGHWGDVDYFVDDSKTKVYAETRKWEKNVQDTITRIITEKNLRLSEELWEPILCLATRHKHQGFREESEIRIAVVTSFQEEAMAAGDSRPRKPVSFKLRGGILVPYIALFDDPAGTKAQLPINKIIVGPHPEKLKRQKAVAPYVRLVVASKF